MTTSMTPDLESNPKQHTKPAPMPRKRRSRTSLTKILATLGPATDDEDALARLLSSGARAFRLNFSHGDFDGHLKRLRMIRKLSEETGVSVAVVGDLQGPKIRVGKLPGEGVEVLAGFDIIISPNFQGLIHDNAVVLPCSYEPLIDEVHEGHRVLINDGAIRMLAVDKVDLGEGRRGLRCRVTVGGMVTTGKGINLPDSDISAPAITERDWECVEWAVENGLDYLALSFVRNASDVRQLQERLAELTGSGHGHDRCNSAYSKIPVIAKIEKPQAVQNIDEILEETDLLMVARGDLGVEMELAHVPAAQKRLIARAHAFAKPVIVATQMLESMISNPSPTRAEVSDVANAIYDGADVVMLSGETAVGRHGDLAVNMMRRIALETEQSLLHSHNRQPRLSSKLVESRNRLAALAHGAFYVVHDADARIVAVWSESGDAAQLLSQIGLRIRIIAYTTQPRVASRMALFAGVTPILRKTAPEHRSQFDELVDKHVLERKLGELGDRVVVLAGKPLGSAGVVNTISLHTVGGVDHCEF
ncbi:MAG: pyruvate kinase [Phycisphaeraceae bacterium]|nr:pyruvate kinase [Phycisphaeraceae bacterium]